MFENTMYQQQPFGMGMAAPMMGGMPQQNPNSYRIPSTLSAEEIKMLRNQGSTFSLGLTQEEMLRAVCNHRSEDGLTDTLVYDPVSRMAKCSICGYEFRPIEANIDYDVIKEDIKRVEDILQTVKLMYIDLPQEAAKEFFPIIGLLEKTPKLVEFAAKNMAKHDNYNYMYDQRNMGAAAIFQNLSNMFTNMSMNYQAQPQQAPFNPAFGGFYQQPAGFPQVAYPQPNPFGYNPQQTYAPGTPQNFAYAPNAQQPAPAAAPVAPTPADTATVTQTVNV